MSYILEALQKADKGPPEVSQLRLNYFKIVLFSLIVGNIFLFIMLWWPKPAVAPPMIQFSVTKANAIQAQLPLLTPHPEQVAPLKIDALEYHVEPKKRLVMINTHHYTEGDQLSSDLVLETIYPYGVVINDQRHSFWLPQTPP